MLGRHSGRRELAPDLASAWGRVLGPGVFADTGGPVPSVVVRVGAVPVLCQLQSCCVDPAADAKWSAPPWRAPCAGSTVHSVGGGCSAQAHEAGQHSPRALRNGVWRRKSHSGHPSHEERRRPRPGLPAQAVLLRGGAAFLVLLCWSVPAASCV